MTNISTRVCYTPPEVELFHFKFADIVTASEELPPDIGEWDPEM